MYVEYSVSTKDGDVKSVDGLLFSGWRSYGWDDARFGVCDPRCRWGDGICWNYEVRLSSGLLFLFFYRVSNSWPFSLPYLPFFRFIMRCSCFLNAVKRCNACSAQARQVNGVLCHSLWHGTDRPYFTIPLLPICPWEGLRQTEFLRGPIWTYD